MQSIGLRNEQHRTTHALVLVNVLCYVVVRQLRFTFGAVCYVRQKCVFPVCPESARSYTVLDHVNI